jgi:hypothetical protein
VFFPCTTPSYYIYGFFDFVGQYRAKMRAFVCATDRRNFTFEMIKEIRYRYFVHDGRGDLLHYDECK